MKNFLFPFILVLFMFSACAQQTQTSQQTSLVELNSDAKVYESPSTSGKMITNDVTSMFNGLNTKGQLLFPFVQEVISSKGDWLEIPTGWVQKKDTHPVSEQSLAQINFDKAYVGQVIDSKYLTSKDRGLANDYGLSFIKPDENSDDMIVNVSIFMERNLLCTAKIEGNIIKCDKFIMMKHAELDESIDGISFTKYREIGGQKIYNLNYGSRLNTVTTHQTLDDMYDVDVFDPKKMTADDFSTMFKEIEKLGTPTRLCISAGTIENLKEEDITL